MNRAIILAGGLGTRLRSVLPNIVKPMAPINGRPFLEYQMDYWIDQGIDEFIISVGYRKNDVMEYFGESYNGCRIKYAIEDQPLGTGGGLLQAINLVDQNESILVLNGDTFFEVDYIELKKYHDQKKSQWTFSLFRSYDVNRYMGIETDSNGAIRSLTSKKKELTSLVNGGVYLVNTNLFSTSRFKAGDKASLEDDLLSEFFSNNVRLFGIEFSGQFIDIGLPDDYNKASTILTMGGK